MYKLHCKDLGADCTNPGHEVTGQTKEEAWERMMDVAKRDHSEMLDDMTPEQLEGMKQKGFEAMSAQDAEQEAPSTPVSDGEQSSGEQPPQQ